MTDEEIVDEVRDSMYGYHYMLDKYKSTEYIEAVLIDLKFKLKNENTNEE